MKPTGQRIAIVGLSGRFPGAPSIDALWRNLQAGTESVTRFTPDELRAAGVDPYWIGHPDYVPAGTVLDDVAGFDAAFFGMTDREADVLDPQQRLLLECVWEALECAGYPPESVRGSVGVYAGARLSEYLLYNQDPPDISGMGTDTLVPGFQRLLGNDKDYVAPRVAHALGLTGPAITVQSACSTSLVAIHLACQALLGGECDLAVAGGACIRVPQRAGYPRSEGMVLSADGHTRTFDAAATGTVFGSGVGAVVLKRLDEALADGDLVHAVILGSAVNNDGGRDKAGFAAPSVSGQARVIAEALAVAEVEPGSIGYVEAHGTATALGDVIEVAALREAFGEGGAARGWCALGSIKANVGHLVQAAGVAGVIKAVLMLRHARLVPSPNFREPNPRIDFAASPFYVATQLAQWRSDGPRRAGVSSFGMGGTNAHVIVEQAPERPPRVVARPRAQLYVLSARSPEALRSAASAHARTLQAPEAPSLLDAAFTAGAGRTHFAERLAVVAGESESLAGALRRFGDGARAPGLHAARVEPRADAPRLAFLFTGQGSQRVGMGRELYEIQPAFREALDRCRAVLDRLLDRPLLEVLHGGPDAAERLNRTSWAQPALVALEWSLAQMWRSFGIVPAAVLGHSVGEIAAACAAGVLGIEDALRLASERGRVMDALPAGGAMAAVRAPEERVRGIVEDSDGRLVVSAWNGGSQVVLSGEATAIDAAVATLAAEGHPSRRLAVSHAFHSPLMEPALPELDRIGATLSPGAPGTPLYSGLTGGPVAGPPDPGHWTRQAREPVLFGAALEALAPSCDAFLEIGPRPTLAPMGRRALRGSPHTWLTTLGENDAEWESVLETVARLYTAGTRPDWVALHAGVEPRRAALPTYPFERRRHWIEARSRRVPRAATPVPTHRLLGEPLRSGPGELRFESPVDDRDPPLIGAHRILGRILIPATAYVETCVAAARQLGPGPWTVEEMAILRPGVVEEGERRLLQTVVARQADGRAAVRIASASAASEPGPNDWTVHVEAQVRCSVDDPPPPPLDPGAVRQGLAEQDPQEFYAGMLRRGMAQESAYRRIDALWSRAGAALGHVGAPEAAGYFVEPVALDCCLQVAIAADVDVTDAVYLPVAWDSVRVFGPLSGSVWSHARVRPASGSGRELRSVDFTVYDEHGTALVDVSGLHFKRAPTEALVRGAESRTDAWVQELEWVPGQAARTEGSARRFVIVGDGAGLAEQLAAELGDRGQRVRRLERLEPDLAVDAALEPPVAVVDLRALDGVPPETASSPALWDEARGVLERALATAQSLARTGAASRLWLVTRGAQDVGSAAARLSLAQAPLWGFGRVVARELPDLQCMLLDLDTARPPNEIAGLADELLADSSDDQVVLRGASRFLPRLAAAGRRGPHAEPEGAWRLVVSRPGELDSLERRPSTRRRPGPGEVEVRIAAAGLNFKDVLNALGRFDEPLGYECAGEVVECGDGVDGLRPGDAVLALAHDSFADHVTVPAALAARKPAAWSFEEAASVPMAFLTAHHALDTLAGLRRGERVLVHAAAGGVGLAAVELAQRAGAEVHATASRGKRAFLRSLGVEHVYDSRHPGFADDLLEATGGEGVHVVLDSLAGDMFEATLRVLARGGRFVEIGRTPDWDDARLERERPDALFRRFLLHEVIDEDAPRLGAVLRRIVADIESGALRHLPLRVFPIAEAKAAFRLLSQARHVGKIVLSMRPRRDAFPKRDGAYLVTGGLGALGLEVADWLSELEAGHVVLMARRQPGAAASARIAVMEGRGTRVTIVTGDVTQQADVARAVEACGAGLRGVVHAAGTLDDGALLGQTSERFASVLAPKVLGGLHLHRLTARRELDFFVLFSSLSGLVGTPGQSSYAAANAFLDALAGKRRQQGLPALSVSWGAWGGAGMAATLPESVRRDRERRGLGELAIPQGLALLGRFLEEDRTHVVAANVDWDRYRASFAGRTPDLLSGPGSAVPSRAPEGLAPPVSAKAGIPERLKEYVAAALGLDPARVPVDQRFDRLGLDSLAAIELRNKIRQGLGIALPMVTFLTGTTVEQLAECVAGASADEPQRPAVAWEEGVIE